MVPTAMEPWRRCLHIETHWHILRHLDAVACRELDVEALEHEVLDLRAGFQPTGVLSRAHHIFSIGNLHSEKLLGPKNSSWGSESRGGPSTAK
jgi:hypothetical protein